MMLGGTMEVWYVRLVSVNINIFDNVRSMKNDLYITG